MRFNDYIGILDDTLPAVVCEDMIKWFELHKTGAKLEKNNSREFWGICRPSQAKDFENMEKALQYNLRKAWTIYLDKYTEAPKNWEHFDLNWKLHKVVPGQRGFNGWHYEHGPQTFALPRYLVWMIYLNDVEDGYTEFLYQDVAVQPRQGRCVIWPASWTHPHRGTINSTNKYIATGWWKYGPFKHSNTF
jgi:hypothetical protein